MFFKTREDTHVCVCVYKVRICVCMKYNMCACMKCTYMCVLVCAMYILWSVHICVCMYLCVCKSLLGCWFTLNDVKMAVLQVNKLFFNYIHCLSILYYPEAFTYIFHSFHKNLNASLSPFGKEKDANSSQKEWSSASTSEAILRLLTLGTIIN